MISFFRKVAWKILGLSAQPRSSPQPPSKLPFPSTLIEKVGWFCACEKIEGDYLEFGLYRGRSFVSAYEALQQAYQQRAAQTTGEASPADSAERLAVWKKFRFFGFDSFEGLPELEGVDQQGDDFKAGQYACSEDEFRQILAERGMPSDRFNLIPGWFNETCTAETAERLRLKKAAIVWIDGDLYESAKSCLNFVTPFLQDGTVLIFDDWYAFRGHPEKGEQLAFSEWRKKVTGFTFSEFHSEGVWRKSFICSEKLS